MFVYTEQVECGAAQFQCHNKECIGVHKVCNGEWECGDGSDELNCSKSHSMYICHCGLAGNTLV